MNPIKNLPPQIAELVKKPGWEWTPEERDYVVKWLCADRQSMYLLNFATIQLFKIGRNAKVRFMKGQKTTNPDAEDVVQSFFARPFKITPNTLKKLREKEALPEEILQHLDNSLKNHEFTTKDKFLKAVKKHIGEEQESKYKEIILKYTAKGVNLVINTYDPSQKKDFGNYLLLCFGCFCRDEGKKIRKRHEIERPPKIIETKEEERIELDFMNPDLLDNPLEAAKLDSPLEAAKYEELCQAVQKCLENFSPEKQQVVIKRCFEGKTVEQTAKELAEEFDTCSTKELDTLKSSVKVWLLRKRKELKDCLKKGGFIDENP